MMSRHGKDQSQRGWRGFSLVELLVAVVVVAIVVSLLVPALTKAREGSRREQCAQNLAQLGFVWQTYLSDHDGTFPVVSVQPGWRWGGFRFGAQAKWLEQDRPFNAYIAEAGAERASMLECPADAGIRGEVAAAGTGERTAFRAFGTSYRANDALLRGNEDPQGSGSALRPLRRSDIVTAPAQLVLLGDAAWHELREQTDREACWHGASCACNLLFLDGSVQFRQVQPAGNNAPMVFEPTYLPAELRPH